VKVRIEKSFDRDADTIRDKKMLRRLWELLSMLEKADTIYNMPHAKKIEGYGSYYRIRVGDYRLGMEAVSATEVILLRFLHRKDIYRYFPKRG
jgi:mRNA interferase RelE/StbE